MSVQHSELWAAKAERCRRSLHTFLREMWPVLERRPFVDSWHVRVIAEHLEAVTAGEIERLIINVPPRTTKSTLTAVAWPAWVWLVSPETQFLCASYSDRLATRHSVKCRRLITSRGVRGASEDLPWGRRVGYQGLLELLGQRWELAEDESLKTQFSNTETGHRIATSVGGTVTGEGGDVLLVDDPLKASDARSKTVRETANQWHDEEWATRVNAPDSRQVLIAQRLHDRDLSGHLLEQGDWQHLCLPAEFEPKHPFRWPDDPRTVEGESLDPERLPTARLEGLKRRLGTWAFAGQMQQRPSPEGGGMFKRAWWRRWTASRVTAGAVVTTKSVSPFLFDRVLTSWDMRFSDSQAASTSYVVGQVWGTFEADRFLLGQVRARLSFTETLKAMEAMAAWQPDAHAILVERKANGAAVIDTLQSKLGGLIPVEPEGGKEARAAAVQPYVEAGNVYLPEGDFIPAPPGYGATSVADFIEELAVFPNGAHDDQVDAFSQALNWLPRSFEFVITEDPAPRGPRDWLYDDNDPMWASKLVDNPLSERW